MAVQETVFPGAKRGTLPDAGLTQQAAFYTDGSDNLRVSSVCSLANVTIVLSGRFQAPDGTIGRFVHEFRANSDRTVKTNDVALARGFILNVTAVATGATVPIGGCFVIVQIIGGLSGATIVLGTLIQGYVTSTQHRAWPGSTIESSIAGPGHVRNIVGTVPAVGAELNEQVPTGARWELLSFTAVFTPGIPATPRTPMLYATTATVLIFTSVCGRSVDAPNVLNANWSSGLGAAAVSVGIYSSNPLPVSLPLLAGTFIRTITSGVQATDEYTAVQYTVREWLEVA